MLTISNVGGLGPTAKEASEQRLNAIQSSALPVQSACRILLARRRISRRRKAITTVQALFRGCKGRWQMTAILDRLHRQHFPQIVNCNAKKGHHNWALAGDDDGMRSMEGPSCAVGVVTRRDNPMDKGYTEGFESANRAAFLWETRSYAKCIDDTGSYGDVLRTRPSPGRDSSSGVKNQGDHSDGSTRSDTATNGDVFELSATACCRSTRGASGASLPGRHVWQSCPAERWEPGNTEEICKTEDSRQRQKLPPLPSPQSSATLVPRKLGVQMRWVPPAVATESSLAQALRCSRLVVSSPSFDAASACRLFSRLGLPSECRGTSAVVSAEERKEQNTTEGNIAACAQEQSQNKFDTKVLPVAPCDGALLSRTDELSVAMPETAKIATGRHGTNITHIIVHGCSPLGDLGLSVLSSAMRRNRHCLSTLTTLAIGGQGCTVGPRGIMALAKSLSSPDCSRLRSLSLSHCCLGRQRYHGTRSTRSLSLAAYLLTETEPAGGSYAEPVPATAAGLVAAAAHEAWDCFFRHLQRMPELSSLSVEDCGLTDRDIQCAANAIQILPPGVLRCLRLGGNSVRASGLRVLLRALTSRRMRLPALWLRRQRPRMIESEAREVVHQAFTDGLLAEVTRVVCIGCGKSSLSRKFVESIAHRKFFFFIHCWLSSGQSDNAIL